MRFPENNPLLPLLVRHLLYGAFGAVLFCALFLYFDIGHVWTLAVRSGDAVPVALLLFLGLFATFGGISMGIGIMSLKENDPP